MGSTTVRNRGGENPGNDSHDPRPKRKASFLALIDALIEHVKMNTRMDIRDRLRLWRWSTEFWRGKNPMMIPNAQGARSASIAAPSARPARRPMARPDQRQIPDGERRPRPMTSAATMTTTKETIARRPIVFPRRAKASNLGRVLINPKRGSEQTGPMFRYAPESSAKADTAGGPKSVGV
jgi:hypothetical protein